MAYQPNSYKKFVATAATAALVASALIPAASAAETKSFTDVNKNYKVAVDYLVANDITEGFSDTIFGTDSPIKRGDAAIFIAKALGLDTVNAPSADFTDVNSRVKGAVNAIVNAKIASGKSESTFAPDDNITRAEMAKILVNAYELKAGDTKNTFTDVNSTWDGYVDALLESGVTLGLTESTFGATQNVTRGQFALFIHRAEVPAELTVASATATDAKTLSVKLSDGTTHEVKLATALEANKATKVTFEIDGKEYTATVTFVVASTEVVSVSAINGVQVEVKFSKNVDVATAEDSANYDISNITGSAVGANPASAEVQADGKTVLLTLNAAATTKTTFTLAVSGVSLEGSSVNEFPLFTQVVVVDDKTNPLVDSVVSKTNSNVATAATVYFTEPVIGGSIKINGTTVAYTPSADGLSASIAGLSLDANATHTVQVINLTDAAGNINDNATKTFTVTKDVAAPTFTVSTQSDEKIVLTFDKAVDASTVSAGSIVLKDEALDTVGGYSVAVPAGYSNKRVEITLPAGTYNTKTTRNFTILASDSVKDTLGNKLVATQRTVSTTKDVVAPVLNNVEYIKDSSGEVQFVVFNFNEKVEETTVYGVTAKNTVNGANVDLFGTVTAGTVEVLSNGTSIRVAAAGAAVVTSGKLEIATPAGFVTDTALTGNPSVATKTVVDFGAGNASALKVLTAATTARNTFVVTYDGAVTYATATNPANYTINGLALPANTTIVYDATNFDDVTITLPAGFIAADDTGAVLRVQNVETASGVKVSANTKVVTVDDNVGPLFNAAKTAVNANGTLSLGFSEAVAGYSSLALGDLVFNVNGANVTVGNGNVVGADGTGSDAGKYVFTFTTDVKVTTNGGGVGVDTYEAYFDVNGDNTLDPTDIIVTSSTTATLTPGTFNLSTLSGLKVSTIASPTVVADTNTYSGAPAGNLIKGSQALTVK